MAGQRGRFDEIELERLRETHQVSDILSKLGVKLKRAGREYIGLSPFSSERTPSFTVNDQKGFYHDFSTGMHGDVIDAVMHFKGMTFPDAVKWLGGVQEVTPEERSRIETRKRVEAEEDRKEREATKSRVERAFDSAKPIAGTLAAAYLEARGLAVSPDWTFDLRFVAALSYRGYASEDVDEAEPLGEFPAMVAAIRNVGREIIGLHRTYLDPVKPAKLSPPGDRSRNRAKKILGEQTGGLIWLSKPTNRLATGEGIETTRAWYVLGHGGDDISIASSVSLGNLAGCSTGSIPHPTAERKWVPNGIPDLERPGVALPPAVEEVILIGDGDSDAAMTRQRLLVAARRFKDQGRDTFVHMAPIGRDFANVLLEDGPAT